MKYVLIISVAILFSVTGIYKAQELILRRKEIERIIDLLEEIRRKIRYFESTLEEIILDYDATDGFTFLQKLISYIKEMDFPDAWKLAFDESDSLLCDSEKAIFKSIGEKLGTSDRESQDKLIGYMLSHFNKELIKAETNENEKKRLYIVMGIASGLAAAILII